MMNRFLAAFRKCSLLAGIFVSYNLAIASGLQVSPISLSLQARENASGLTLSNTGDKLVHAQVRVYQWFQDDKGDQLTPSRGLLASPPMIELKPGEKQLIRIIRAKAPPKGTAAVEDTYRLLINEIPVKSEAPQNGLAFTLSYSLPVFVKPVGISETTPKLNWTSSLTSDGKYLHLSIKNNGNGHAQLADLKLMDSTGKFNDLHPGLLGYVLPGAIMHWKVKMPASTSTFGGKIKVMINGTQSVQDIIFDIPSY